jgi:hypothetical protein
LPYFDEDDKVDGYPFREQFGNFLNQLETSYNVSQTAITEITKELFAVTNCMHSQTVKKVAQSLSK